MTAPIVLSCFSTKGGVGKTTLTANISAVLADIGLRILMIDADVQPSLSKFYPLSYRAPNGVVELLFGEQAQSAIEATISNTVYPNLDIILSNNITADIQVKLQNRVDRAFLLKNKLQHPYFQNNYDVILIDTQGAVGALQEAAAFASSCLISPIMPEVLSAREFLSGTQEFLSRLKQGEAMGLTVPYLRAVIYAQDRTKDARMISDEIRNYFNKNNNLDGKQQLLTTIVPEAKASAVRRVLNAVGLQSCFVANDRFHYGFFIDYPAFEHFTSNGQCVFAIDALNPDAGDVFVYVSKLSRQNGNLLIKCAIATSMTMQQGKVSKNLFFVAPNAVRKF